MELIEGGELTMEELLGVNPDSKLLFVYDNAGNQKQRFYCESIGCPIPNPPAGRVAPNDFVFTEEEKIEDLTEERVLSEKDITFYPNPTKGNIVIKLHSNFVNIQGNIYIYNSTGVKVLTIPSNSKKEIKYRFNQSFCWSLFCSSTLK